MANNKQVISIGVQLDYKKELESMISTLRGELSSLKNAAKDIELSASLQKQIEELEKRMLSLSDSVENTFNILEEKVDAKAFMAFQTEIKGEVVELRKDFKSLRQDVESAFAAMDATKSLELVKNMENVFASLDMKIQKTTNMVEKLFNLIEPKEPAKLVDVDSKNVESLKEAEELLEKLLKVRSSLDKIETRGFSKINDEMSTAELEDVLKKQAANYDANIKKQKKLVTENENSPAKYYAQQYAFLELQKTRIYDIMAQIDDILSTRTDVSDRGKKILSTLNSIDFSKFQTSTALGVVDSFKKEIEQRKKEISESVEKEVNSIDIGEFKIKGGKISVPIEIKVLQATRDRELEESIKATISNLQNILKDKPVYIDVKLRTRDTEDKTSRELLTTQKKVREYFDSKETGVQTLNEKDIGRNFFATFTEEAKEAYNVAKVVIDEINKALHVTKLEVTIDGFKIEKGALDSVKNEIKGLFNTSAIDKYIRYFATNFAGAVQKNEFEKALLSSLNGATDKWVMHFNDAYVKIQQNMGNPETALKALSNTENIDKAAKLIKDTGESEIKIQLSATEIDTWRQNFLKAITEVSATLKSSLSSSASSSVDIWHKGMIAAVNDVSAKFTEALRFTGDLSSIINPLNQTHGNQHDELYYNLAGWRDDDIKMNQKRTGTSVSELVFDSIVESEKSLTDTEKKKLETILKSIDSDRKIYDMFNGALERSGIYDLSNGKFYGGYTFDKPHSSRHSLIQDAINNIKDKSNIIDFHSHPAKKNPSRDYTYIGSDLTFSGLSGDFNQFKKEHRDGIKKFAVLSNKKVHYLDFSKITSDEVDKIAKEYSDGLKNIFNKVHRGKYNGKDYGDRGVIDFDEKTKESKALLDNVIKKVTGLDPSSISHIFDVEDIKNNPQKMKDIGFLSNSVELSNTNNQIEHTLELLENMTSAVQKISSGDGFKIDTSSIDNLVNSLQEILIILQRIHEESNIALSNFGVNKKSTIEDVRQTFDDILLINDSSLKNGLSQSSFRDLLLPVFKQYRDATGKKGSSIDLFDNVLKDNIEYLISKNQLPFSSVEKAGSNTIAWYDEYIQKTKEFVNVNEQLKKSQKSVDFKEGFKFDISSDDLEKIVSSLREILDIMQQLYNTSDASKLNNQWISIEENFKRLAKDDGSIDKRHRKDFSNLVDSIYQYQQMGGGDFSSLTDNQKTIDKINNALAKKTKEGVLIETESVDNGALKEDLKEVEVILQQLNAIIEPVNKSLTELINLLSKEAPDNTLGSNLLLLSEGLAKFAEVNTNNLTEVVKALNALAKVPLSKLQSIPAFTAFVDDLNRIQVQADVIKDLATIMKETKGKTPISTEDGAGVRQGSRKNKSAIPADYYSQNYKTWATDRKVELEKSFQQVGETTIKRTASGIVEMTNVVQDADGSWQKLTATMDASMKVFEKTMTPLTEAQGLKALGLYSDKEEKQLQLEIKAVLGFAKEYETIMAKIRGFDELTTPNGNVIENMLPTRLTSQELETYTKIEGHMKNINALQQSLSGASLQGQTTALLKQLSGIQLKAGDFGAERIRKASDLIQELDNEVRSVLSNLNKFSDPEAYRAMEKISADYSWYITDYINGLNTRETLDKKTGKLLSKYRNVTGFYNGQQTHDAREAYLKDFIKSTFGDFDYDFSKGSKMPESGDVQKVVAQYKDLNNIVRTVTASIDTSTKAVRVSTTASSEYVNGLDKFFTSLKAKAFEGLRYLMAYVSIQDIWRYFRQGVDVVREFDTALTEMRKVSDEALITLQKFQGESFDLADEVGTTALQIQQSTADFMRLGDTLSEAKKNAATANTLMNVSEFESIDEATTSLIAMEAAYKNLSGTEIIDKLNNIGNNYAISTDGIANALQDSASALVTAGNDIDESIALITAGNAVVQDTDKVGNGLRTIALRLTGTKAAAQELEELGEETDSMITTQSKLRDTILEATKTTSNPMGFDILDANKQYKSTKEILLGIADIWDEIAELDKKNGTTNQNLLLETMAGKNRANILASILQNPDVLRNVYIDSQNSEGSAQEELDKYLDSMDARIQKLKNAAQELAFDFLDSDTLKVFIDFATTLIQLLDNIAEHFNFVTVAAGLFASGLLQSTKNPLIKFGNKSNGKWGATPLWKSIQEESEKDQPDIFKEFVKQYKEETGGNISAFGKVKNKISSVFTKSSDNVDVSDVAQKTIIDSKQDITNTIISDVKTGVNNVTSSTQKASVDTTNGIKKAIENTEQNITKTISTGIENNMDDTVKPSVKSKSKSLRDYIKDYRQKVRDGFDYVTGGEYDEIDKEIDNEIAKAQKSTLSIDDEKSKTHRIDKAVSDAKNVEEFRKELGKQYLNASEDERFMMSLFYPNAEKYAEEEMKRLSAGIKADNSVNDAFKEVGRKATETASKEINNKRNGILKDKDYENIYKEAGNALLYDKQTDKGIGATKRELRRLQENANIGAFDAVDEYLALNEEFYKTIETENQKNAEVLKGYRSINKEHGQIADSFRYLDLNEQYWEKREREAKYSNSNVLKAESETIINTDAINRGNKALMDTANISENVGVAVGDAAKETKKFTEMFDEYIAAGNNVDDIWIEKVATFKQAVADSNGALKDDYETFLKFQKGAGGLGDSLKSLGNTLLTTFASAALSMGVSFLIQVGITAVYKLATATKRAIEAGQEARKTIKDIGNTVSNTNSTIKTLGDTSSKSFGDVNNQATNTEQSIDYLAKRYSELKQGTVDNKNVSLSDSEYQEFLNISNELADVMPDLQYGTDDAGNAILSLSDNAYEASENIRTLYENYLKLQHSEIADNLKTDIKGAKKELNSYEEKSPYIGFSEKQAEDLFKYSDRVSTGLNDRYMYQISWEDIATNGDKILEAARDALNTELLKAESEEEKRAITEELSNLENYFIKVKQTIGDVMGNGIQYIKTSDAFADLNYNLQNDINTQMPSIKNMIAKAWIDSGEDDSAFEDILLDSIIVPLNKVSNDPEMQNQLHDLFNLDVSEMSLDDVKSKYTELLSDIFGDAYTYNEDSIDKLFGFDKYKDIQDKYQNIMSRKGFDLEEATDISSLSDMQLAYNVLLEDNDNLIDSYEKLKDAITKAREAAINDTSYLNDYTAAHARAHSEQYDTVKDAVVAESTNMARGIKDENYSRLIGGFSKTTTPDVANINGFKDAVSSLAEEFDNYNSLRNEIIESGADYDYSLDRVLFGSVDLSDTRRKIEWTEKTVEEFGDALTSWGFDDIIKDVEDGFTSHSTVLGSMDTFYTKNGEGIPVAFSPIMVDGSGKLLDKDTVMDYIQNKVIGTFDSADAVTMDAILELKLDEKGLIADVGETASFTADIMHFVGADGGIQSERANIAPYLSMFNIEAEQFLEYLAQGAVSVYSLFETFDTQQRAMKYFTEDGMGVYSFMKDVVEATDDVGKLGDEFISVGKDGKVSFKKNENAVNRLSKKLNISTEAAGYLLDAAKDIGAVDIGTIYAQAGKNSLNGFLADLAAVSAAMSEISQNGYLTYDTMTNLVSANGAYADALVNTASGMIVNNEEMREMNEQAAEYATADIQNSVEELTDKYLKNNQVLSNFTKTGGNVKDVLTRIENANGNLKEAIEGTSYSAEQFQDIWSAYTENQSLENTIIDLQRQQSEIRANVSLMKEYKDALQTPNMNANFLTTVGGKEGADKLYEQGWWGTDDFITYAKLIGQNGWDDKTAILNYEQSLENVGKYLTEDASGVYAFFDDAIAKGEDLGIVLNEDDGYKFDETIFNMEKLAESMGVTTEFAENMVLALHDAGQMDVDLSVISDGIRSDLSTLGTSPLNDEKTLKNAITLTQKMGDGVESATDKLQIMQALQDQMLNGKLSQEMLDYANETLTNVRLTDEGKIQATTDVVKDAVDGVKNHIEEYRNEADAASKTELFKNVQSDLRAISNLDVPTINAALGVKLADDATPQEIINTVADIIGDTPAEKLSLKLGMEIPEDTQSGVLETLKSLQAEIDNLNQLKIDPDVSTKQLDDAMDKILQIAGTLDTESRKQFLAHFGIEVDENGVIQAEQTKENLGKPVEAQITYYAPQGMVDRINQVVDLLGIVEGEHDGSVTVDTEYAEEQLELVAQQIADMLNEDPTIHVGVEPDENGKYTASGVLDYYKTKLSSGTVNVPIGIQDVSTDTQTVTVTVNGAAEGAQQVTALNRALTTLGTKSGISVSVETGTAQSQIQGLRDTLNALNATIAQPTVSMALANFYSDATVVDATLNGISKQIAQPHVSMQYGAFRGGASDVRAQMAGLNGLSAYPSVSLSGGSYVLYQLNNIRSDLNSLDGKTARTYVETVKTTKYGNPGKASGTVHANASGTANAYAGGTPNNTDVAIKNNETALVNELGYESIVFSCNFIQ